MFDMGTAVGCARLRPNDVVPVIRLVGADAGVVVVAQMPERSQSAQTPDFGTRSRKTVLLPPVLQVSGCWEPACSLRALGMGPGW